MNPLVSIVRNWSLLACAQVASSAIALVFMVFISRRLGDVEFGRLFLALTLTTLVGVAVDLGLSQVMIRAIAREHGLARPYLRRAALVVAAAGTSLYLLLLGAIKVLGFTAEVQSLVGILGLLMIAEGFSQILGAVFQAHERMLIPALTRLAGNAFSLVVVVPLIQLGQGATAVAGVLVLAAALRVLFQLIQLRRLDGLRMSGQRAPAVDVLLRGGLPFLAAQTLGLFVAKVDVPILGRLSGEAAVGWYAASSRLMEASNFVPVVLLIAMFPVLSRLWVQSPSEFQITVRKTLHFLLILTVPVTVTLFVLSQEIIGFFFTLRSYAPAVPILRVQAFSIGLIFVDYLLTCVLMAAGRERVWLAIVGAACVLNPALNFVLIPAFDLSSANGAIGAAIATLITEVFILVCALRAMPSGILGLESARVALRAAALGIGFAAVLFAGRTVGIPWVVALAVGGAMYLAAAQGFGLLPAELTAWVRGVVSRRAVASSAGGEDAGAKLPREVDAA